MLLFSYLLGSIMTGFIVSKTMSGKDIREHGSKNVGARNAGTLFGKKAFFITAIGDGLKGLIVVLIAKLFSFSYEFQALFLLIVMLGHLYPIFLKFRGGKGIATFIGGLLMFDVQVLLWFLIAFVIFVIISRSATTSVMLGFVTIPFITFIQAHSHYTTFFITLSVLLLLYASRSNIKEKIEAFKN
jgi:acyl phosphate:glycerol-3-phosphate acyltransferase